MISHKLNNRGEKILFRKRKIVNGKVKKLLMVIWCLISINSMTAPVQAMNKLNWYKTVLNTKDQLYHVKYWMTSNRTTWVNRNKFHYYKAIDIDKDGTKELLLSTTNSSSIVYGDQVLLLAYQNGKIVPVSLINTATVVKLSCKGQYLCYYNRMAGFNGYDIYMYSEGKLKKILSLNYDNYTIKNGKQTITYRKNEKKCSKKIYEKYLRKYALGKEIFYQSI